MSADADNLRVRLRVALAECGWSARFLARRLGCTDIMPCRWMKPDDGTLSGPPQGIVEWVESFVAWLRANPPPSGWRRSPRLPKDRENR